VGYRSQRVKREHTIIAGAEPFLSALAQAPGVRRVIPGRIDRSHSPRGFYVTLQYRTESGFKLIMHNGSSQELFVVSEDAEATGRWLEAYLHQDRRP
jgi:hypothetical protein